jgi:predicted nucleotidyltransferase
VFLFGSALRTEFPEDIDLIVVYEPPLTPHTAPEVRPHIEEAVAASAGLPTHLMFFTLGEAKEPGRLANLNARLVYSEEHMVE